MLAGSTRRFDLYDFFSVFIPGTTFVLGTLPFLPHQTPIDSIGLLLPMIILGFSVGRAIHTAANSIDDRFDTDGHRDHFRWELQQTEAGDMDQGVVDRFYKRSKELFGDDIGLPDDRSEVTGAQADALYALVRSYIHIDSRGRSRTFQAVYSFYRSMWLVSLLLCGLYFGYGLIRMSGLSQEMVDYYTYISSLDISAVVFVFGSLVVITSSYTTFRGAKSTYQRYFIQYLISDFLVLRDSNSGIQAGDPTRQSAAGNDPQREQPTTAEQ